MNNQRNEQTSHFEYSQSAQYELSTSQLTRVLEESKKFMIKFIEELNEKALTPISQVILSQYNGQVKPVYLAKDILGMVDKRIAKMVRNKKIKKNWNVEDIILLLWTISKYLQMTNTQSPENLTPQEWDNISKLIPGSSSRGCMFKFISLKKVKLSVFNWSKEEQEMLKSLVKKHTPNRWKQISQYLYQNNPNKKVFRTSKQCRQHWNCYLDPKLKKGPWSGDQDFKLLQNVSQNKGQRKWSSIKHLFNGRTENALKNRYNLLIERQRKLCPQKSSQTQLIKQYLKLKQNSKNIKTDEPHSMQLVDESEDHIYEEPHQQIPKPCQQNINKFQKSSFKLSEAYQNSLLRNAPTQHELNYGGIMLLNLHSAASIYTNDQGFYTSFFKPFQPQS